MVHAVWGCSTVHADWNVRIGDTAWYAHLVTQQRIDSLKLIADIAVHRFIEVNRWPGSLDFVPRRLLRHQSPAIQRLYSTCGPIRSLGAFVRICSST